MSKLLFFRGFSTSKYKVNKFAWMIIIVFGLPGSGKSFFAKRLANALNAAYLNSDQVRKKLSNSARYSPEAKQLVYDAMLSEMKKRIDENKTVVLDATFFKDDLRRYFVNEIAGLTSLYFIEVIANEAVIKERLKKPRVYSDADFTIYEFIKKQWEPLNESHLILESTNDNIEAMLEQAMKYLELRK